MVTSSESVPQPSALGLFERWLSIWVALAIGAGLLLGNLAPGLFAALASVEYASVNLIVAALILTRLAPGSVSVVWLILAMLAALVVGILAGIFNGVTVAIFGLPPILATLGSGLIFTGFAIALTNGTAVMGFPAAAAWIGNATLVGIPVPLVLFALLGTGTIAA